MKQKTETKAAAFNHSPVVYAVGLGPGARDLLTPRAEEILKSCTVIAGYSTYLKLFPDLLEGKKIIESGMTHEIDRCKAALEAALEGEKTAVISSGDAGIYGMAGLLLELTEIPRYASVDIQIIPGITACIAGAALAGAPLMNDFCCISLSDLMIPQEKILKRVQSAACGDFVTALYNPGRQGRLAMMTHAIRIFRESAEKNLPVLVLHDIGRINELVHLSDLDHFPYSEINMTTLVIIGNSDTLVRNGRFYCKRGYPIEKQETFSV